MMKARRTCRGCCRSSYDCQDFFIMINSILILFLASSPSVNSFVVKSSPRNVCCRRPMQNPVSAETTTATKRRSISAFSATKDWDNLELEDENGDEDFESTIPVDMKYIPRNVQRQFNNFLSIREVGGKELTNDIYARETRYAPEVFWFVGKIARISDVTVEQCVHKQFPLIVAHAGQLRPIELFPARREMELWVAPGDSEMDVAYNRPHLTFTKIDRPNFKEKINIKNNMIGFQGEIYERGEEGFRTSRTDDGRPLKPEIQGPSTDGTANGGGGEQYRAPTDKEMQQLEKKLEGKDLNELYEEQERRKNDRQ